METIKTLGQFSSCKYVTLRIYEKSYLVKCAIPNKCNL